MVLRLGRLRNASHSTSLCQLIAGGPTARKFLEEPSSGVQDCHAVGLAGHHQAGVDVAALQKRQP
eukprot:6273476-Lingulodinium_polyedra.AAC.1